MNKRFSLATQATKKNLIQAIPLVISILLLIALFDTVFKLSWLLKLFHHGVGDSVIGAVVGSVAAGNPITSYVLAGELTKLGISLAAVTAFILTWVTVGLIQLPAESMMLGKKFAIIRNLLSFISAIIIGLIIQMILG